MVGTCGMFFYYDNRGLKTPVCSVSNHQEFHPCKRVFCRYLSMAIPLNNSPPGTNPVSCQPREARSSQPAALLRRSTAFCGKAMVTMSIKICLPRQALGLFFARKMLSYLDSSVPDLIKSLLTFERIWRHSKRHIVLPETVRKNHKVSDIPTSSYIHFKAGGLDLMLFHCQLLED